MLRILREVASTLRQAFIPSPPSHEYVVWGIRIFTALAVVVVILHESLRFGLVTSENVAILGALIALIGVVISQVVNTLIAQSHQRKQQEIETIRAQAQQKIETRRAQAYRFQAYLDRMEKLLIDHQLRQSNKATSEDSDEAQEARLVAQAQTLALLEGESDPTRKHILVLFLYDSGLLDKDNPILTLARANLSSVNLAEANLSGANLSGANLSGANLTEANLIGANLNKANLTDANLNEAYLREASLVAANLSRADISRADLSGANLRENNLREASLSGAHLTGAKLSAANLSGANLSGAHLSGAYLTSAHLRDAELSRANLSGAHLGMARLQGANLSGARLNEANLFGAKLQTANLLGAKNLTQEQINEANGDETTMLPPHLQRPAHWSKGKSEES